jgi:hypothetical protein
MPKRETHEWLSRVGVGLTSGALALSVLSSWGSTLPAPGARAVHAEDIDCYNDKDLYDLPECIERRMLDTKSGNGRNEAQGAGEASANGGEQQGGGQPQNSGGGNPPAANNPPAGGGQQASGGQPQQQQQQQQAPQPSGGGDSDEDKPEPPRGPLTDPKHAVLTIQDAGKEATQYIADEGSDKYGKFVRNRFERDRANGSSAIGPNVIDSKVWVAKDLETAKTLFKEQAAIKNMPERKEGVQGPVEKIKPPSVGEEFAFDTGFYQDDKVWQHYRFVFRQGTSVGVLYLFGRQELFQDAKDRTWTGFADWFSKTMVERM